MKQGGIVFLSIIIICITTGCQTAMVFDTQETLAITPTVQEEKTHASTHVQQGTITLTGKSLGKNRAKFSWDLSEEVYNTEKLRLVRSDTTNPVFDEKNYWFQVHNTLNEIIWIDLPTGDHNFRICTFEDNHCVQYSNDLELYVE
ncbi:MAG: hypothetical protein HOE80_00470 [Candidatus Magasanikbacteria bacterium]|jgi:hypothetical protein|nr:hypothetical protein [Candidatus Magasanikbacteria bacterium]MBT4071185.1 hypothetical protein [Candidatus Magasanikbacteria bacterium]